jgi:hypothetical protein
MQGSRISQLIQMGSIGISDTTSVDSACHPEEIVHGRLSFARPWSNDLQAARRRGLTPIVAKLIRAVPFR